jgi:hypothetical protein
MKPDRMALPMPERAMSVMSAAMVPNRASVFARCDSPQSVGVDLRSL